LANSPPVALGAVGHPSFASCCPLQDVLVQACLRIRQGACYNLVANTELVVTFMMSCDFYFDFNDATLLPSDDGAIVEIKVVTSAWPLVAIAADSAAVTTVRTIAVLGTSLVVARRRSRHPAMAST
jgi:L-lactate permease